MRPACQLLLSVARLLLPVYEGAEVEVVNLRSAPAALLVGIVAAGVLGCGARSDLSESLEGDETTVPTDGDAGTRSCLPECAIGHECCLGDCSGPAVPMPSDCCSCLAGEVSSAYCGGRCGG